MERFDPTGGYSREERRAEAIRRIRPFRTQEECVREALDAWFEEKGLDAKPPKGEWVARVLGICTGTAYRLRNKVLTERYKSTDFHSHS